MFWGLKGATERPLRTSQRQIPVTMVLLPASEVVPWTINDGMMLSRYISLRRKVKDPEA
jgi:hypothetical protein